MKIGYILMTVLLISAIMLVGCSANTAPNLSPAPGTSESEPAPGPTTPAPTTSPATTTPMPDPGGSTSKPMPAVEPNLPSGKGKLVVYVTDPPPPKMDEIWVDIKTLEVHKAGSGWTTVAEDAGEFDLKAIEGIQQYLAEQIMDAGKYTQIRLEVYSVRIVVGEDEYFAKVPSEKIKLVGNFIIEENNNTAITLDFNGEKSVLVTGKGDYIFKPVIQLLVEHPSSAGPVVTSVDPDSGIQGQTLEVTITGTNLTGASAVSFGDNVTVDNYTVDSDTQVTANISIAVAALPGVRDVSVTTPEGTGTLIDGFTVMAPEPTVTLVDPDSGTQGETLEVTITGTNLTGASAVSFGDNVTVDNYTVDSDTQVTANITIAVAASPGARDVSVTTPEGTGTLIDGFIIKEP
jgi:hypothetical protein